MNAEAWHLDLGHLEAEDVVVGDRTLIVQDRPQRMLHCFVEQDDAQVVDTGD